MTYQIVGKATKRNSSKQTKTSVKFVYKNKQYNHILPDTLEYNGQLLELETTDFMTYAHAYIVTKGLNKVDDHLDKLKNETPEERLERLFENDQRRQDDKENYAMLPQEVKEAMKMGALKGLVKSLIKHKVIPNGVADMDALRNYF